MEGCGWGGRRRFKEGSRAGQQLTEEAIKSGEFELTVFAVIFEELDNMAPTINKLNIVYYTVLIVQFLSIKSLLGSKRGSRS